MKTARHFLVSGRVQGVFYRAATQEKARGLGLTGWVRNRPDGGVELVACGTETELDALERWLWQGPPAARVESVVVSASGEADHLDFTVRR